MDSRFLPDNRHLEDIQRYTTLDPQLNQLKALPYVYQSPLLKELVADKPGIYTLHGAHQTGKTTLTKQWIATLLNQSIPAPAIAFVAGELVKDYHMLYRVLQKQLAAMPQSTHIYLVVDEVTSVRDWIKAIKQLAAEGLLTRVILLLTGSYATLPQIVRTHFPNLEHKTRKMDFHLYPLSFRETVMLKHGATETPEILYQEFQHYLKHGGFLTAINEIAIHGHILDKTLSNYAEWIQKEFVQRGKQARFLSEILHAILKNYNSEITWNALAQQLTIDHPKTIGDYFALLEDMDVLFVQHALIEETLKPAPKKARKLMFTDPFLFHAIHASLSSSKNFDEQITTYLENTDSCSRLVETCVISQFQRFFPTYYIKGEGKVGLAYVHDQRFWPIETTWAGRLRAKDLKQILKYSNGRILTKTERSGIIDHIKTEPLPLALWLLHSTD